MDKYRLQWVGAKCGQHGPYTFYKSFKFVKNSKWRTISLGEFFFVKCSETDPLCIAELQLLWEDKGTEGIMLSSLRLYFLPEHTPDGRHHSHGENEVIAVNGKAVMSIEDLLDWIIMEDVRWIDGFPTICPDQPAPKTGDGPSPTTVQEGATSEHQDEPSQDDKPLNCRLRRRDDARKSNESSEEMEPQKLMVVSYPSYCRYHANMKRIEKQGDKWHSNPLLKALGLLSLPHPHTKLLFCKDEFEHPIMEEDERLCEYTAPKLKGRPRKKKVKLKSDDDRYEPPRNHMGSHHAQSTFLLAHKRSDRVMSRRSRVRPQSEVGGVDTLAKLKAEFSTGKVTSEELFLTHLYKYMKDRNTPIDRVPHLGFKQIDLFAFFDLAMKLGGYRSITSQKQWKVIYDQLGGNPNSTSAATCTRKHYERLLFPFEQHLRTPDKPGDGSATRDRKRKKDKKDKKRSRVKHVREQLQELEAMRKAERQRHQEMNGQLEQVRLNSVIKKEPSASSSTVTTTAPSSTATVSPSVPDLKPPTNGMPLMTMPPIMPQPSVMQLPGGHFFPQQLGLKNMGPVILAIPQVPVITTTTVPKQEPESRVNQEVQRPPQQLPTPTTVLDKVAGSAGSASVIQQEVKEEGAVEGKKMHQVANHSMIKKEHNDDPLRHGGVEQKHTSPLSNLNNVAAEPRSQESPLTRPSVIQHTHHKQVKLEGQAPSGLIKSPLQNAVQPNDLILRNMKKEQFAAEHEHYKKVVTDMPGLLGAGPRFLSPFMTILPQSPLLFRPPLDIKNPALGSIPPSHVTNKLNQSELDNSKSKPLLPESTPSKPSISVVQPIRSSSSASSSSSCSKFERISERAPEQEEPCDLSLPRKRRRHHPDDELGDHHEEKRRQSVISSANLHPARNMIRNSPVHRLRTSDKKLHKSSSLTHSQSRDSFGVRSSSSSHSPSPSPLTATSSLLGVVPKVKMTPNPRGSITQGIIDPATHQSYPSLHKFPVDPAKASIPSKTPTPPRDPTPSKAPTSSAHDLAPRHFPHIPPGLGLPVAMDATGKPLPPLTDLTGKPLPPRTDLTGKPLLPLTDLTGKPLPPLTDLTGKPLPPLADLSHLSRFPMLPYYPMLPRPAFLPAGSPFLPAGLVPGIPSSQAETMLQQGLLFRPPFPFAPSVPYSTAQLPRDSTQASLYRS